MTLKSTPIIRKAIYIYIMAHKKEHEEINISTWQRLKRELKHQSKLEGKEGRYFEKIDGMAHYKHTQCTSALSNIGDWLPKMVVEDENAKGFATASCALSANPAVFPPPTAAAAPEIIDLESESPLASATLPLSQWRNGQKRPWRSLGDDVEVVNVFPPRTAAAVSSSKVAAKLPHTSSFSKTTIIHRIREVFPLVSRSTATAILDMAIRYSPDDILDEDRTVQLIFTVLADDPRGNSITETTIAAASIGGRINSDSTSSLSDEKTTTGRQKVAQLECGCCFAEYDFEEMVSCRNEGHLFCKTCLQRHTEQRVFGLGNFGVKSTSAKGGNSSSAFEILCMHSSGCTSGFHEGHLRQALSDKVMKKYDELQYMAVMEKAGMNDASKCPKCQYLAFADESLVTFHCPQCNFKSCRKCGDEAHPGIRCDQVESKHETDGRKVVEEAMTNAKIRVCPRSICRKKFMKSDGCNKMTCSCGAYVCYVCRKEILKQVGYQHFCQTPHCKHASCNKCPLYTNAEEDDKRAVKEAGMNAAKSVNGTGKKKQVNVDVESLLKDPPPQWGRKR